MKKKLLSIVAVFTLVLAMATTAFADEAVPSVTADDLSVKITESSELPSESEIGAGNKVLNGKSYDATLVHKDGTAATADEAAAYIAKNGGSITVDFSGVVGSVSPVKVLHKTGGAWQSESFSGAKVTVKSLSPFAFIVKADAADTSAASTGSGAATKSPQTGYNTAAWAVSAVLLALCAGYCAAAASKKASR